MNQSGTFSFLFFLPAAAIHRLHIDLVLDVDTCV